MASRRSCSAALVALAVATVLAACGQTANGAGVAAAPTSSTSLAPTRAPQPTMAGPTSLAAWNARQGFGGGDGLREIGKGAHWLQENAAASDAASWASWWNTIVEDLQSWLDAHPATACWAGMHKDISSGLASVHTELAAIRARLDAGHVVPLDRADRMVAVADQLLTLSAPAGCS